MFARYTTEWQTQQSTVGPTAVEHLVRVHTAYARNRGNEYGNPYRTAATAAPVDIKKIARVETFREAAFLSDKQSTLAYVWV